MPTPKDFDTHFSIPFFTVPDIYLQALNKKKILYSDETKLEFSGFHNQFFIAIAASVTNLCLHLRGFSQLLWCQCPSLYSLFVKTATPPPPLVVYKFTKSLNHTLQPAKIKKLCQLQYTLILTF